MSTGGPGGIKTGAEHSVKYLAKELEKESQESQGVKPLQGKPVLPREPSKAPTKTLAERKTEQSVPQPKVNPQTHGTSASTDSFLQQHRVVESLQTQKDLLDNLPLIRKHLDDPRRPASELPFMVVYVKEGKDEQGQSIKQMTSLIPMDSSLKADSKKAKELMDGLKTQLGPIDSHYNTGVTADLNKRFIEATAKLHALANAIKSEGGEVPATPRNRQIIYLDLKLLTASPATTDPATGQTTGGQQPTKPDPSKGRYEIRPKPVTNKEEVPPVVPQESTPPPAPPIPKTSETGQIEHEATSESAPDKKPFQLARETYLSGKGPDGHADIFLPTNPFGSNFATNNIASVNAGTHSLKVGGGGINGRFSDEIHQAGDYKAFHAAVLEQRGNRHGIGAVLDVDGVVNKKSPGLAACLFYIPEDADEHHQGTVFLDVFKEDFPAGNPENRAMIYVVPPKGDNYPNKEAFLKAVRATAARLYMLQNRYNLLVEEKIRPGLQPLPVLRTCAFSSDLYRDDKASEAEVVAAIKSGFATAQRQLERSSIPNTIREIQYEDGSKKLFSGTT
ncbi:MAG: hypothetical protein ACR2PT_21295 [Endozoicomonas sp.]